tara:strand:- start:17959 stop:18483 length:525 start_codon:yes stop_codon:yes gene_type:complete
MKKLTVLGIFLAVFAISCEGPTGPPGFDGTDGVNIVGETYEVDNVDFTPAGDYRVRFTFPQNIVNGDAILVYRLEDVQDGLDIWEPLPTATIFFEDGGFLQYRFNYTIGDVDIIIESDDLALIGDEFMLDQVFRIIVLPSDLIGTIDTSNINTVMAQLGLSKNDIHKIDLNMTN